MSRYLQKFVDTYRVVAEYNRDTNDFPRVLKDGKESQLDPSFDDLYIPCSSNSRVYHVGGSKLESYIPSLIRGHNILKAIYSDVIGDVTEVSKDYPELYKQLTENGIVFDIYENDEEVLFKFKATNIETIMKYMQPKTHGASISPFSSKNLPKTKYTIPEEDLAMYKEITRDLSRDDLQVYLEFNKAYLEHITNKKTKIEDINADMKLKGLKGKEYYHATGRWNDFISFIDKFIKDKK